MQGTLMPIGGAEDRRASRLILTRFFQLCGGSSARILVIPTASSFPRETGTTYQHIFTQLGAARVTTLHPADRYQANAADRVRLLDDVSGVFMSGGDQLRLVSTIGGTRLASALHKRFKEGMHIAGTSAGASALSRQMIAFGRSGLAPSQRMVQMAAGLGLADDLIIDQHFGQRHRLGRLMTAVALHPGSVGVGVDEDTALMIAPNGDWEVLGSGTVTLVDGREMEYTNIHAVKQHKPIEMVGVKVEVLPPGVYTPAEHNRLTA